MSNDEQKPADSGESPQGKSESPPEAQKRPRSYRFLWILGAVLLLAGVGVLVYHLLIGRYYVSTDDAYVSGDLLLLAPQVSGTVTAINADETQFVTRGELLVQLDPHDTDISLAQARANLAETVRDVAQLFAAEHRDEAALEAQQAQLTLADQDLTRDRGLIGVHGVSQEDLQHSQETGRSARAGLRQAGAALAATRAAVVGTQPDTHPRVLLAEENVRSAWLASRRTRVLAPVSGYIARRIVQLGQQVTPGTELLAITPLDSVWIDANFKETQLRGLRIGQPVRVTADLYGSGYRYHARVLGLTAGTGSALAVLPAENATGNWIKIVQRLPVRVGLDPNEVRAHPLFLGLSTNVEVDIHDADGAALSQRPAWPAAMVTDVYQSQEQGVETEIRRIVNENLAEPQALPTTAQTAP